MKLELGQKVLMNTGEVLTIRGIENNEFIAEERPEYFRKIGIRKVLREKRPYADPTSKRRSVTVNEADWRALKQAGGGNASEGIRRLVRDNKPAST